MADPTQLRSKIEQAVSQHVGEHAGQLQRHITEQVLREIEPLLASIKTDDAARSKQTAAASAMLNSSMAAIQESTAQADILKALLEGVSAFSPRSALFVVRGTALAGWQARGFSEDNIRGLTLDGSRGLAARAIQERTRVSAHAAEFDASFIERQGNPADGSATVFPLVVKDKVAAILYCDAGHEGQHAADYAAVEVLTRFTCLWLEHAAAKKHLAPGGEASVAPSHAPVPGPPPPPAAAHAPATAPARTATSLSIAEPSLDHLPAEEQDVHKKAKRFAKLLVDEIKLYNQSKVAEGKQNRDLYRVLREDIEKSRATYDKRYGSSSAAAAKYFDSEIVRILADNDPSLLGSDFPG